MVIQKSDEITETQKNLFKVCVGFPKKRENCFQHIFPKGKNALSYPTRINMGTVA